MKYAIQMGCMFATDIEYAVWGYRDGVCVGYRDGCVSYSDGMVGVTEKGCIGYGDEVLCYRNGVCSHTSMSQKRPKRGMWVIEKERRFCVSSKRNKWVTKMGCVGYRGIFSSMKMVHFYEFFPSRVDNDFL
jgi:hypothetical protein